MGTSSGFSDGLVGWEGGGTINTADETVNNTQHARRKSFRVRLYVAFESRSAAIMFGVASVKIIGLE